MGYRGFYMDEILLHGLCMQMATCSVAIELFDVLCRNAGLLPMANTFYGVLPAQKVFA